MFIRAVCVHQGMWSVLLSPFNFTPDTDKINTFFPDPLPLPPPLKTHSYNLNTRVVTRHLRR